MRRLTLGALILGGGALLALPFRKPAVTLPPVLEPSAESQAGDLFDDDSIEMLVREVTQDVEVPEVYHPHTDYSPQPPPVAQRRTPLTYEDLAVPVDADPFYAERFNATVDVAETNRRTEEAQRVAELDRPFKDAHLVETGIAGLPPGFIPADAVGGSDPSRFPARRRPQRGWTAPFRRTIQSLHHRKSAGGHTCQHRRRGLGRSEHDLVFSDRSAIPF